MRFCDQCLHRVHEEYEGLTGQDKIPLFLCSNCQDSPVLGSCKVAQRGTTSASRAIVLNNTYRGIECEVRKLLYKLRAMAALGAILPAAAGDSTRGLRDEDHIPWVRLRRPTSPPSRKLRRDATSESVVIHSLVGRHKARQARDLRGLVVYQTHPTPPHTQPRSTRHTPQSQSREGHRSARGVGHSQQAYLATDCPRDDLESSVEDFDNTNHYPEIRSLISRRFQYFKLELHCRISPSRIKQVSEEPGRNVPFVLNQNVVYLCTKFGEWQKRGLPHVHLLLWFKEKWRPNQKKNDIKSAEIPDTKTDKRLYNTVVKNMIHGPCGRKVHHKVPPCAIERHTNKQQRISPLNAKSSSRRREQPSLKSAVVQRKPRWTTARLPLILPY
ncbi:hypothetical protein PR048_000660 [Dryococelus australis]|uniref:Helitron helicase-like domain-containing protein n=1 Tax=Dryococelus australis TaxID=614101 RepID=A0ABQ9IFA1_9NEOP|nr:hypothetical protein PR048_000660 [Dryococelus australis]